MLASYKMFGRVMMEKFMRKRSTNDQLIKIYIEALINKKCPKKKTNFNALVAKVSHFFGTFLIKRLLSEEILCIKHRKQSKLTLK